MTLTKIPKLGSPVVCDGELCMIRGFGAPKSATNLSVMEIGKFEGASFVAFEGRRYAHKANASDLRYDEELEMFYLWGRLLSVEQKKTVMELRDDGTLPARKTRMRGMPPAGGEHLNLYKALFAEPGPIDTGRITKYKSLFAMKLTEGFADPDADDSMEG